MEGYIVPNEDSMPPDRISAVLGPPDSQKRPAYLN